MLAIGDKLMINPCLVNPQFCSKCKFHWKSLVLTWCHHFPIFFNPPPPFLMFTTPSNVISSSYHYMIYELVLCGHLDPSVRIELMILNPSIKDLTWPNPKIKKLNINLYPWIVNHGKIDGEFKTFYPVVFSMGFNVLSKFGF